MTRKRDRRTAIYRCYDGDVLLYVGKSINPAKRMRQHRWDKKWWVPFVERVDEEWIDGPEAAWRAEEAEKAAIATERPVANIANPAWLRYTPMPGAVIGVRNGRLIVC